MSEIDPTEGDVPASPKRFCIICGKKLSQFNKSDYCFHHPDPEKERRRKELDARFELMEEAAKQEEDLRLRLAEVFKETIQGNSIEEIIIAVVCKSYQIEFEELKKQNRQEAIVRVRHILMYLLFKDTYLSYMYIGNLLGDRDHTTVMHGVKKISNELDIDPTLLATIRYLRSYYQTPSA